MKKITFKHKLQKFLAQPNFSELMKKTELVKQPAIVIGCSQFSDKLSYGYGHGLFVANGYPPMDTRFPLRFPEGRRVEWGQRLTEAHGYLLKQSKDLVEPVFLWDDKQVLIKNQVYNALKNNGLEPQTELAFCLLVLKNGYKIIGAGSWYQFGAEKKFVIANVDSCLLQFIKPEQVDKIVKLIPATEINSDFSDYLITNDREELIRNEFIPGRGGVGIFIS